MAFVVSSSSSPPSSSSSSSEHVTLRRQRDGRGLHLGAASESRQRPPTAVAETTVQRPLTVDEATEILAAWDRITDSDRIPSDDDDNDDDDRRRRRERLRTRLGDAVHALNEAARVEREYDGTTGRVMLGICADDAPRGLSTLKSWVTALRLPRGLLHGMDVDGVPTEWDDDQAVYVKYNSGGVYTFADIRKSGLGFDALWKPGDALLEAYDGTYRGVYFQVELTDAVFRQYLVPLDVFADDNDDGGASEQPSAE